MDEIIVPIQWQFPNCRKYTKCCSDDKEFWNNLQNRVKELQPRPTHFRIKQIRIKPMKPPKDFEGW